MSDIGEVRYWIQAVDAFIAEPSDRQLLISTLNSVHAGLGAHIVPTWQNMRTSISTSVYITCFSELAGQRGLRTAFDVAGVLLQAGRGSACPQH